MTIWSIYDFKGWMYNVQLIFSFLQDFRNSNFADPLQKKLKCSIEGFRDNN